MDTSRIMTETAVTGPPATARRRAAAPRGGSLAGVLVPLITVAIAVVGLRVPGGLPALQAVAFGLVIVGAVSGAVLARSAPERVALWQVAFGALVAAVGLTAARIGDEAPRQHHAARAVATMAVPLVIAISVHMLLALPDGRLVGRSRRVAAILGGLRRRGGRPAWCWSSPATRSRPGRGPDLGAGQGVRAPGGAAAVPGGQRRDRQRMQWMAVGAMLAADCRAGRRGPARARRVAGARSRPWPRAARCCSRSGMIAGRGARARARTAAGCWSRCCRSPVSPWWSRPSTW